MTDLLDPQIIAHEVARRLNPDIEFGYGPPCCAHRTGIRGYGRVNADVMFIGIAPGRTEMQIGRPLVGPSGKLLDATLEACGYDRSKCYATNLCCFWKDEPTPDEIEGCSARLLAEIQLVKPKLIVALGALASERLTGFKVGKARGSMLASWQINSAWLDWDLWLRGLEPLAVMPTWHPAAILRVPSMGNDLVRDFLKIPRFLNGELDPPAILPAPATKVIDDPVDAQITLHLLQGRGPVAADVETENDSEDAMAKVICMAVAYRDNPNSPNRTIQTQVFTRKALEGLTDWHPDTIHWTFHNGQFDTQAIFRTFGVWLPIKDDTMLLSYACDERPGYNEGKQDRRGGAHGPGYHGLKTLAREYCQSGFYEEDVKGTLGKSLEEMALPQLIDDPTLPVESEETTRKKIARKVAQRLETPDEAGRRFGQWLEDFYKYNARDAAYTLALLDRLPKDRSDECYREVLLPAANAYAKIQYDGIAVDEKKIQALITEFTPRIEAMRQDLQAQAHALGYRNAPKLKRDQKARDEYEAINGPGTWPGYEPINLGSNKQMGEFLFKTLKLRPLMFTKKGGKPSTAAEHLDLLKHPFCTTMKEHNQWTHVVGTYLVGVQEHVRADHKFHSYPWLHGTTTGRRAWTEPAMQTFPQDYTVGPDLARIREIIVPSSPDMVLIEVDYEQIEVWIGALLSGDQNMLADLQEPYYSTTGDTKPNYHSRVAREVLRCLEPDDSKVFKAVRQDAKTTTFSLMYLVEENHLATIIGRSREEAKSIRNAWYRRYKRFGEWQREILKEMRRNGEITTPFDYRRRFPVVLDSTMDKVAVNHPIQSTGGTLSLNALVALQEMLPAFGARVLLDVHDSLLAECPKYNVIPVVQTIQDMMGKSGIPGWPILKTEAKVGSASWGHMIPYLEWLKQNLAVIQ